MFPTASTLPCQIEVSGEIAPFFEQGSGPISSEFHCLSSTLPLSALQGRRKSFQAWATPLDVREQGFTETNDGRGDVKAKHFTPYWLELKDLHSP